MCVAQISYASLRVTAKRYATLFSRTYKVNALSHRYSLLDFGIGWKKEYHHRHKMCNVLKKKQKIKDCRSFPSKLLEMNICIYTRIEVSRIHWISLTLLWMRETSWFKWTFIQSERNRDLERNICHLARIIRLDKENFHFTLVRKTEYRIFR